jgi:site-specific DNA-methyltransferase (adenine-specific)
LPEGKTDEENMKENTSDTHWKNNQDFPIIRETPKVIPLMNTPSITLHQGDALALLKSMPAGSVDLFVTDPAYWTLDKWRGIGTTTRLGGGSNGDSDPDRFFPTVDAPYLFECIKQFARILPKNGHAWILCDGETQVWVQAFVRGIGFKEGLGAFGYAKLYPVIKRAKSGGRRAGLGYHGRGVHEYAVLLEKGRRRFTTEDFEDVFEPVWDGDTTTRPLTPSGKPYPTAKPVALYRRLIELSSSANELVCDPFAGSGTCGAACLELGRRAVLCDTEEKAIQTMQNRFGAQSSVNIQSLFD